MCEVTLFFQDDRQELAAGLTLTVMLVMYTMYQSISDSTAKTAYLKMLDYWLLFCLLVPFLTFMIEIYWFIKQSKVKTTQIKNDKKGILKSKILTKSFVRWLVPIITVTFMVSYFMAAFVILMVS